MGNSKWTISVGLVVLSGSGGLGFGFLVEDTSYTIGISIDLQQKQLVMSAYSKPDAHDLPLFLR